jgi:hypothetical protein
VQLAGTGTTDPRWLEKIIEHPPTSLSTLEYWIGALDVDFAGREGGGHVDRPCEPARGTLRIGVLRMGATFRHDIYHSDAHQPRDLSLTGVSLVLDVPHAAIAQRLEARHGPGRAFLANDRRVTEYGRWWYLSAANDGAPILAHEVARPTWAIPVAPTGALAGLLDLLHDCLVRDAELAPMYAALTSVGRAAGAAEAAEIEAWDVRLQDGGIDLDFHRAIALDRVLTALRWDHPVSWSSDVHFSRWCVYPRRRDASSSAPGVGHWDVELDLDGWPSGAQGELPQLGRVGPSPVYDVRACSNQVSRISIRPRR